MQNWGCENDRGWSTRSALGMKQFAAHKKAGIDLALGRGWWEAELGYKVGNVGGS